MSDTEIVNILRQMKKQNEEIIRHLEGISWAVDALVRTESEPVQSPSKPVKTTELTTSREW